MFTVAVAFSLNLMAVSDVELTNMRPNEVQIPARIQWEESENLRAPINYQMKAGGRDIKVQYSPIDGGQIFYLIPPNTLSGNDTIRGELQEQNIGGNQSDFHFVNRDNKQLYIYEGNQPVMAYNYGMISRIGVPKDRARASYVHPLYGMDGEIISDDFPEDHYHHRGLFWTWPQVIVGDEQVDLWHLNLGQQKFGEWLYRDQGSVAALLGVKNYWHVKGEKAVEETAEFVVYRAGAIGRAIDVKLRWRSLDKEVTIIGKKERGYGGFCFRPAPRDNDSIVITTNEGQQQDSNLVPFPWGDFSAKFRGRDTMSGLSIFVDENHWGFPPGWTLRHYGFLGVAWPGHKSVELPKEDSFEVNYRIWIHKGDALEGKVEEAYSFYQDPVILSPVE